MAERGRPKADAVATDSGEGHWPWLLDEANKGLHSAERRLLACDYQLRAVRAMLRVHEVATTARYSPFVVAQNLRDQATALSVAETELRSLRLELDRIAETVTRYGEQKHAMARSARQQEQR